MHYIRYILITLLFIPIISSAQIMTVPQKYNDTLDFALVALEPYQRYIFKSPAFLYKVSTGETGFSCQNECNVSHTTNLGEMKFYSPNIEYDYMTEIFGEYTSNNNEIIYYYEPIDQQLAKWYVEPVEWIEAHNYRILVYVFLLNKPSPEIKKI